MEISVKKTVLPLSICCALFGFYAVDVRNKKTKCIVTAYCCLLAALYFITWSLDVVIQVEVRQFNYNFYTVLYQFLDLLWIINIIYCSVKCTTENHVIGDIYNNIDFSANYLNRMGVRASYRREQLYCVACSIVILTLWITLSCYVIQQTAILRDLHVFNKQYTLYNIVAKFSRGYSIVVLLTNFAFVLYIIKRRILILRHAVQKYEVWFEGKPAWSSDVTVSISHVGIQRKHYFMEILITYACLYDAHCSIRKFFDTFYSISMLSFALSIPIAIINSVRGSDCIGFYYSLFLTALQTAPLVLCISIRRDLQTIQTIIGKLHWSNGVKHCENLKKLLSHCVNKNPNIDGEYFEMDSNLLLKMFDFVMLFIFAILS